MKKMIIVLFLAASAAWAQDKPCDQLPAGCSDEPLGLFPPPGSLGDKPLLDEHGKPILDAYGKPILSPAGNDPFRTPLAPAAAPGADPFPQQGSQELPSLSDVQLSPSKIEVLRENYPSGELAVERRMYDRKLDGPTKEFYKNGQVMNEWNYRLGERHGESRSYYRNGDLKTLWPYRQGKLHGEVRHYHARKILKSVETYKDGVLTGTKLYNAQGLPIEEAR